MDFEHILAFEGWMHTCCCFGYLTKRNLLFYFALRIDFSFFLPPLSFHSFLFCLPFAFIFFQLSIPLNTKSGAQKHHVNLQQAFDFVESRTNASIMPIHKCNLISAVTNTANITFLSLKLYWDRAGLGCTRSKHQHSVFVPLLVVVVWQKRLHTSGSLLVAVQSPMPLGFINSSVPLFNVSLQDLCEDSMNRNESKCEVLHLGRNNPGQVRGWWPTGSQHCGEEPESSGGQVHNESALCSCGQEDQ